jgi:hypothetical protein
MQNCIASLLEGIHARERDGCVREKGRRCASREEPPCRAKEEVEEAQKGGREQRGAAIEVEIGGEWPERRGAPYRRRSAGGSGRAVLA